MIENTEHAEAIHFLQDTEESLAIRDEVYSNPKFIQMLQRLIPKFVADGYF